MLTEGHKVGDCLWHILAVQAHNNSSCRQEAIPFADLRLQHMQAAVGRFKYMQVDHVERGCRPAGLPPTVKSKYTLSVISGSAWALRQRAYRHLCYSQAT